MLPILSIIVRVAVAEDRNRRNVYFLRSLAERIYACFDVVIVSRLRVSLLLCSAMYLKCHKVLAVHTLKLGT